MSSFKNNLCHLSKKIPPSALSIVFILFSVVVLSGVKSPAIAAEKLYVGSAVCAECHEKEYENFSTFTKKAHSFDSLLGLKKGLTEAEFKSCFECHTTGYGKPGGFSSIEETPELSNLGCESCHGPGSLHRESEDPEDIIRKVSIEHCTDCHNQERVAAFDFKPLVHGGAH
ncbi:MAG: cytochrome C [Deltaproteobacteria bacterium]|nr:cytochrome C [Deltaproteobacteria bacterium]